MALVQGESAGMPSGSPLASVSGVDVNQTSKVTLYTVPAGKSCVITSIVVRNASINLTAATTGFGFDANAVNISPASALAALSSATIYSMPPVIMGAPIGAAGAVFGTKPTIPQGAPATVTVDVFGYLF